VGLTTVGPGQDVKGGPGKPGPPFRVSGVGPEPPFRVVPGSRDRTFHEFLSG